VPPIETTPLGILIDGKLVQPPNAPKAIVSNVFGKVTLAKPVLSGNANAMALTPEPISTLIKFLSVR
jgi:hypothetical protein